MLAQDSAIENSFNLAGEPYSYFCFLLEDFWLSDIEKKQEILVKRR